MHFVGDEKSYYCAFPLTIFNWLPAHFVKLQNYLIIVHVIYLLLHAIVNIKPAVDFMVSFLLVLCSVKGWE